MHWKSPLFSSFWYVSSVNTTSETDINKPFVWYLAWAKADHTNCLSLFTGDNSGWYFQPDNSWQDKSRFRRNRLQPGTGNNLHNQSWSARRASVVFSDRTWLWWNCVVSFWLIFQCMTDSHLSPLRWSHLVKVTMTGSDVRPWSTSLALEHLSAARQGKAGHASSCLCFQSLFQGGLGREPTVDHPHGSLNAAMIPGVSMNLPGGGARGGIWQVLRHPCLVHKGL